MKKVFYFEKLRMSAVNCKELVIQGYCASELLKTSELKVGIHREDGSNLLLHYRVEYAKIACYMRDRYEHKGADKRMFLMVKLPKEIAPKDELVLFSETEGKRELIVKFSGAKVLKKMNSVNAVVELVTAENDDLVIKGWAIDSEETSFELLKKTETGFVPVDAKIERFLKAQAMQHFEECREEVPLAFMVRTKREPGKYVLRIKAGDRVYEEKIRGISGSGSSKLQGRTQTYILKAKSNLKAYGLRDTTEKCYYYAKRIVESWKSFDYNKWLAHFSPSEKELEVQRNTKFAYEPKFSILVPLYETQEIFLKELVDSVQAQTYSNWELCFSDGSRDTTRLRELVGAYAAKDERIHFIADAETPLGISENTNQALTIATGDYIVLGDHDDVFTPDAFYECVKVINETMAAEGVETADVIYTDEDKMDAVKKDYFDPCFKPDFNIDLLRSCNYITHMFVASAEVVKKAGGFRGEFNGSQDYDFILRCVEQAKNVCHVPKILYHWRFHANSVASAPEAKLYCYDAGERALREHYERLGIDAQVEMTSHLGCYKTVYSVKGNPLVSIIIPNKDHVDDLKVCLESLKTIDYDNYEVVIVENNSTEQATFDYYEELKNEDKIRVITWEKEFNYSAINNFGVKEAKGEYILFLNNDVKVISPDLITDMLGCNQREEVGIVGARLYFEDDTIQHAGVVVGLYGTAGHVIYGMDEELIIMNRALTSCDYSAVTAACMMISRDMFERVGGFDEDLAVAFNDIDLCLKVRKENKLVVYDANVALYHYESKSRGKEDSEERKEAFKKEQEIFKTRWNKILTEGDPYYNVNLTLEQQDFSPRKIDTKRGKK